MLNFEYKGISAGKYVEGEIEALNNSEAAYKLKEQKVIITKLIQTKKAYGNIFNVVGDDHHSIYNIARLTASTFNSEFTLCDWPEAAKKTDVGNAVFDNRKLRSFINWQATRSLSDGLEQSKEFFDMHLSNYIFYCIHENFL